MKPIVVSTITPSTIHCAQLSIVITATTQSCKSYCEASARADAEAQCGATASAASCRAQAESTAAASCQTTCTTQAHSIVAEASLATSLFGGIDLNDLEAGSLGDLEADLEGRTARVEIPGLLKSQAGPKINEFTAEPFHIALARRSGRLPPLPTLPAPGESTDSDETPMSGLPYPPNRNRTRGSTAGLEGLRESTTGGPGREGVFAQSDRKFQAASDAR